MTEQTSKQIGDAAEYHVLANLTVKGGFEVFKMPEGMRHIDIGVMDGNELKSVQVKSRLPVSDG